MDKDIKARFHQDVVREAAFACGLGVEELREIGGFQNFIYEYEREGRPFILRITSSSHRSMDMVRGEVEWMRYLTEHGVQAARPVLLKNGEYTEIISREPDHYFVVTAFEKASGNAIHLLEAPQIEQLGQITGKIHALTKDYQPSVPTIRRNPWHENHYFRDASKYIPSTQPKVLQQLEHLMIRLNELPQDKHSYGLIHGDISVGNYLADEQGNLTLIDFDECEYGWFLSDIAIPLFYHLAVPSTEEEMRASAAHYLEHFFRGYNRENRLDPAWIDQLPLFLKLREFLLYIAILRSFEPDQMDDWCQWYMQDRQHKLEQDIPFLVI